MTWSMLWRHTSLLCNRAVHGGGRNWRLGKSVYWQWVLPMKSIEQSCLKVNRSAALQEIRCTLWNLTFHYCIHNSLPPVHVLSQIKPVHALPQNFLNIYFIFPSVLRSSKWFLSLILPCQTIYTPLSLPCLPHAPPIPLFLIWLHDVYLVWSTECLVKIQARVGAWGSVVVKALRY